MASIVKEIRLICVEQGEDKNHNKWWTGELYDNGDVRTRWGRVGGGEQSKDFPNAGEAFLLKKAADKQKGKKDSQYVPVRTIAPGQVTSSDVTGDLLSIARTQIKTTSPALDTLIKRLVDANIHTITSHTQISYDSKSGLFTTPLGIVTLDGISEARDILADCTPLVEKKKWKDVLPKAIEYLKIVPQNIGMRRLEVESFFPNSEALKKQLEILDSLESSCQALNTPVTNNAAPKADLPAIFKVSLGLLEDEKEFKRIVKKYNDTRKDMHVCAHLKVKQVYIIDIESNRLAFENGKKVGEVRELWHGTKKANLLSILKSGLKVAPPSTAKIAGKMFGNGVYFAHDSTKSLNYSYGYWDGKRESECFMLMADVALGRFFNPTSTYGSLPRAGFDSTWARAKDTGLNNDEYIVYNDDRFHLKYLVEFA